MAQIAEYVLLSVGHLRVRVRAHEVRLWVRRPGWAPLETIRATGLLCR